MDMADGDHVLVCVAWPYANGPLHLVTLLVATSLLTFMLGLNVLVE